MKYSIVINQVGIVRAGLLGVTDFSDWAIIGYIKDLFAHPKSVKLPFKDNLFVWINYSHIMEELPMLGISTKNPLSDRFKKLKKLHLIETVALKDNTIYVRLTEGCMDIFSYKNDQTQDTKNTPPINPNSDRLSIRTPTGGINPNSDSTSSISSQAMDNSSIKDSCVSEKSSENACVNNKKKVVNKEIKEFIDYAYNTHLKNKGNKLHITGSKDGNLIKNLLKIYSFSELKKYWDVFLDVTDKFIASTGHTIGVFSSLINKVIVWSTERTKQAYKPSYYVELN